MVQDRCTKVKSFLFSGTKITIIIKFTHIMGTSFTNLSLFFHESSFIINILSNPCERRCTPLTQNSMLKRQSSSHMPCFNLSPAKWHPQIATSSGPKQWKRRVLNRKSQEAMRTWIIFLFGRTIQIHFNFFDVCTYCSELIMAPLFKNSANKIPLLSHKTLAITRYTAVCAFHMFSLILPTVPI